MSKLPPVAHLETISREYPNAWKQVASIVANRQKYGDWPSWCYCPIEAIKLIAEAASGGREAAIRIEEDPSRRAEYEKRSRDVYRLAALAAWRPTQGIYRFHPELLSSLVDTDLSGELPVELLHRLPEWCVYVELRAEGPEGFFAHLDYLPDSEVSELRLLIVYRSGETTAVPIRLLGTLEESARDYVARRTSARPDWPIAQNKDAAKHIARLVAPFISVLLYLCAGSAEMTPTRAAGRRHARPPILRNVKGQPYQQLSPPEVWETGFRLGTALQRARIEYAATGGTGEANFGPHIRRAHHHKFWLGTGEERKLDCRWLPPIPVLMDVPSGPTIRNVDEKSRS